MKLNREIPRRSMTRLFGMAAAAALLDVSLPRVASASEVGWTADKAQSAVDRTSSNGWTIEGSADSGGGIWTKPVPGSGVAMPVRIGLPEVILVYVVARFNYEIDALGPGEVSAFAPVVASGYRSNLSSGTAVEIRAGAFPVGSRGNLTVRQLRVVRDIVSSCRGVLAWGGDLSEPAEGFFQIDRGPADASVQELADELLVLNGDFGKSAASSLALVT